MNIALIVIGILMITLGLARHLEPEEKKPSDVIVSEKAFISPGGVYKYTTYEDGSSKQENWRIITPSPSISGHGLIINDPTPRLELVNVSYSAGE